MNILFCSEGFIVDGVASYNLYLAAALCQAGHNVAIIGRWAGFKGFQKRHRETGVPVIQTISLTPDNQWFVKRAVKFNPQILITDSRRAFPLSQRIRSSTDARVITIFHDPPQRERQGRRSLEMIIKGSDAWVTSEKPIYDDIKTIDADLPMHWIQRPITGMVQPTPLPPKDPFHVVCLGRLSRWKSPGLRAIVEKAADLKQAIPSLKITVVGGGRRRIGFWKEASRANKKMKERFVHIAGMQTNPQPWLQRATVVCAGATAAIEAILIRRPVLAFSGFWLGLVTPDNLDAGVATHFGERTGDFYVRDNTDVIIDGLIDLYRNWDHEKMTGMTETLQKKLYPEFDSKMVAKKFEDLMQEIETST